MELAVDNNKDLRTPDKESMSYFNDLFIQNYYESLTSKELDRNFDKDVQTLINSLKKVSESDRKFFIAILSNIIELYLQRKIEKEIDDSLFKLLKF